MTDFGAESIDQDALIAEAREYVNHHNAYADSHLLRDLADELEVTAARLREAEAAIDRLAKLNRKVLTKLDSYSWHKHDDNFVRSTREDAAVAHDVAAVYLNASAT